MLVCPWLRLTANTADFIAGNYKKCTHRQKLSLVHELTLSFFKDSHFWSDLLLNVAEIIDLPDICEFPN